MSTLDTCLPAQGAIRHDRFQHRATARPHATAQVLQLRVEFGLQPHLLRSFVRRFVRPLEHDGLDWLAVVPERGLQTASVELVGALRAADVQAVRCHQYVRAEQLLDRIAQEFPWSEPALVALPPAATSVHAVADVAVQVLRFEQWSSSRHQAGGPLAEDVLVLTPLCSTWYDCSAFDLKERVPQVLRALLQLLDERLEVQACFRDREAGRHLGQQLQNTRHSARGLQLTQPGLRELLAVLAHLGMLRGYLDAGRLWLRLLGFTEIEADYLLAHAVHTCGASNRELAP